MISILGFKVEGEISRGSYPGGLRFRVEGVGCRVNGIGFQVSGLRSQVSGFGFGRRPGRTLSSRTRP